MKRGWKQGHILSLEEFKNQRFLLRECGSGTRELFDRVVEQAGIRKELYEYVGRILHPAAAVFYSCGGEI